MKGVDIMKFDLRKMVLSAILVALTVVIVFTFPKIVIPPWSATLAFHVPLLLAMFISPFSAVGVAVGGAIAFMFINPLIALRALSQIVFVLVGYCLLKRGVNMYLTLIIIAPIHAVMESLVVLPFTLGADAGKVFQTVIVVTGLGTVLHHFVDCVIAVPILKIFQHTRLVPLIGVDKRIKKAE